MLVGPALFSLTLFSLTLLTSVLSPGAAAATFVGGAVCATCHRAEAEAWSGSDHDLAMQEATAATVLGDFDDAVFEAYGVTSTFFRKDSAFYVRTEGADGALHDYEIAYTFGVSPLQQYLIAFPGGRYQALGIAWDSRKQEDGGQRWFHLYPNERIRPDDELHWTGINQNWNFMCAECHSTNLRRNYDFARDQFATTWSEIDVSCEACHGPGSEHVAWAENDQPAGRDDPASLGLVVDLTERRKATWDLQGDAVIATRSRPPPAFRTEVEVCAPCHSRRAPIGDGYEVGAPLLDGYRPSLLALPLYHADGQIRDEVFVYGSFLQSRMYQAGVTCSDCHDPHSLDLKAEGNAVCAQCHLPDRFDAAAHHFHPAGGPGSRCVDCHAPATTYMVVDPRRDHSFRVPRPDLSVQFQVPNACNGCHEDRTAAWAATRVEAWYGSDRARRRPHYAAALAAGRSGGEGAADRLAALAADPLQPEIVRAAAVDALGRTRSRAGVVAAIDGLMSDRALIRLAAVERLEALPAQDRVRFVFPLLADPVRAVRMAAARALAPVPLEALPPPQAQTLAQALDEVERLLRATSDRPETLITLGNVLAERRNPGAAEKLLRGAIDRFPTFPPAYVNLADLYRATGRDADGEAVLRRGLERAGDDAGLAHALGLHLVRQKRYADALDPLARAAELAADNARYGYVYALALQRLGQPGTARDVLAQSLARNPNERDLLEAMVVLSLEAGDKPVAERHARRLIALFPDDPQTQRLLRATEQQ